MNNRGFLSLGLMGYAAIAAGVLFLAMSAAIWVQTQRLESAHATIAAAEALGRQAAIDAAKQAAADQRNKERTDEDHKRRTAAHARELTRLRANLASRVFVPSTTPTPGSAELACFDRAQLDGALRRFAEGAAGLVGEGAAAVIDLDAAKGWAKK